MFSRDGLGALQKGEISCVGRESDRKSMVVQQVATSLHRLSSPGCQLRWVRLFRLLQLFDIMLFPNVVVYYQSTFCSCGSTDVSRY